MEPSLRNIGPLAAADVSSGDLIILTGPQAGGKSIFLQFLKPMIDGPRIVEELETYGYCVNGRPKA
jgi:ABC-type iron transport system FetAB ATPase subunit